jgi:hypothetical protein
MDTESESGLRISPRLEWFEKLLGENVFYIPCEWGTKKPVVTYVERPLGGTKSPAYLALFDSEPRNIAVYLGKASGGLCAIDFDVGDDLAAFLAANPKLARTTRSRGSRGGMVWLRIDGDYPASSNTGHFEWRADKRLSTICGGHPKGMDYSFVVEAAPLKVRFDEVVWPDEHRLGPLQVRDDGAKEPLHAKGVVVDAAEVNVRRDFPVGQGAVKVLRPSFGHGQVADAIEVLVQDGDIPAPAGFVGLLRDDVPHHLLPVHGGEFRIGGVEISTGQGEV